MKKLIVLLCGLSLLASCAKIHVACPTDSIETVTIGGSNVGYTLLSMAGAAAKSGGLMAKAAADQPPAGATTVDYNYLPIFGQDFVSCGGMPAPTPPAAK